MKGEVDCRARLLVEARIENRTNDTDDFSLSPGCVRDLQVLPNGVLVMEKIPAERLINDHDPRIIQVVMLRKDASLKQRNSHCVKIIGASELFASLGSLILSVNRSALKGVMEAAVDRLLKLSQRVATRKQELLSIPFRNAANLFVKLG